MKRQPSAWFVEECQRCLIETNDTLQQLVQLKADIDPSDTEAMEMIDDIVQRMSRQRSQIQDVLDGLES